MSRLKEQASAERGTYVRQLINENDRRGLFLQGGTLDEASRQLVADGYQRSNVAYAGLFDRQLTDLENALRASASEHRSQAFVSSALVIAALLAALVIVIALLRSLLTPIQVLRQGALDVARNKLPDAVRRIRDGEEPPKAEPIRSTPPRRWASWPARSTTSTSRPLSSPGSRPGCGSRRAACSRRCRVGARR